MKREILLNIPSRVSLNYPTKDLKSFLILLNFYLTKWKIGYLIEEIQNLTAESNSYRFLLEEEEIYTVNDLKEIYK